MDGQKGPVFFPMELWVFVNIVIFCVDVKIWTVTKLKIIFVGGNYFEIFGISLKLKTNNGKTF